MSSQARSAGYPEPQEGSFVMKTSPFETSLSEVDDAYENALGLENVIVKIVLSQLNVEIEATCSRITTL
jgi:hypothetical protein